MLTPGQLFPFYKDLTNPEFETHLAMVHSRFSTNTFPSWDRAQPNRFMSHNGEINTLRGNVNAMTARQGQVATDAFNEKLPEIFPIIDSDCSDSGSWAGSLFHINTQQIRTAHHRIEPNTARITAALTP